MSLTNTLLRTMLLVAASTTGSTTAETYNTTLMRYVDGQTQDDSMTSSPDEYFVASGPIRSLFNIRQDRDLTTTNSGSHNRIIMHARTTLFNLNENHDIDDDVYFFFEDCFKTAFGEVVQGDDSTDDHEQDGSFHLRSFIVQQTTTAMHGDNRRQLQSQPDQQDDDKNNDIAINASETQSRLRGGNKNDDTVVEHSNRELSWPFSFKKKKLLDILSLVEGSCGYSCDPGYDDDDSRYTTRYDDDDGWYTKKHDVDDDDDGWYTRRDLDGSGAGVDEGEDEMDEIATFEELLLEMLRQGPFEVFHELEKVDVIFGP